MSVKIEHCIYVGIDEAQLQLFEEKWEKLRSLLPAISLKFQDEQDAMHALFNVWLRYQEAPTYLIVKPEKTFTHSFTVKISSILRSHMPYEIQLWLLENRQNSDLFFIFCYSVYLQVTEELDQIVEGTFSTPPKLFYGFNSLTNEDIEGNEEFQCFVRNVGAQLIRERLTQKRTQQIYIEAIEAVKKYQTFVLK